MEVSCFCAYAPLYLNKWGSGSKSAHILNLRTR